MFANRKYEELSYPKNQKMCDPILITLLKMQPHYSHSSRKNATPSSGTSPLASYKGVPSLGTKVPVPSANPFCQCSKNGPVFFRFNRLSGCNSRSCPFPHVCRRCQSADHSIVMFPSMSFSKASRRSNGSTNMSDRSKR